MVIEDLGMQILCYHVCTCYLFELIAVLQFVPWGGYSYFLEYGGPLVPIFVDLHDTMKNVLAAANNNNECLVLHLELQTTLDNCKSIALYLYR